MTAALMLVLLLCLIALPIVVVVVVAKASRNYARNLALARFLESSPDLKPVGVGYRLLAFLLDALVLGTVFGLISAGSNAMLEYDSESVTSLVALVAWFAYFAGMEIIWGATVGKMALRLTVIRAGGGRPGPGAALVRSFCKIFGVYSPVGIITTIVCISGSPAAQRFGDRLVGTTVVRKPKKALSPSLATTPPVPAADPAPTGVRATVPPEGGQTNSTAEVSAGAWATEAERTPASADKGSITATPALASYCGNCGAGFDLEDDRYCARCGHLRAATYQEEGASDGHRGNRLVLVLALLAVAAVASVAVVVMVTRGGGSSTPTTADSASEPSDKTLLGDYLRRDLLPLLGQQMSYAAWKRSENAPPGAQVIGAHRMTKPVGDSVRWWGEGKQEGESMDEMSVRLGAVTPPKVLRGAHRRLVRVFRTEAERWFAFTACERKSDSDAFWPAYRRWQSRSKTMLKTQQHLLADWFFQVRVEADKEGVQVPSRIKSFAGATMMLTE